MVIVLVSEAPAGRLAMGRALASGLGWPLVDADTGRADTPAGDRTSVAPLRPSADRPSRAASIHAVVARALGRREHLVMVAAALAPDDLDAVRGDLKNVRFVDLDGAPPPGSASVLEGEAFLRFDAAVAAAEVLAAIRREFGL